MSDAKAQLADLVRRAEAGEEVVLTRHGRPAVHMVPVKAMPDSVVRDALMDALRDAGGRAKSAGLSAACSQDVLYGADGLPR